LDKTNGTRYGLVISYSRNIKQIWHVCLVRSLNSVKKGSEVLWEFIQQEGINYFGWGLGDAFESYSKPFSSSHFIGKQRTLLMILIREIFSHPLIPLL
jgi:hypothetical protein